MQRVTWVGVRLFIYAIVGNHYNCAEALLRSGADVNIQTHSPKQSTPEFALNKGKMDMLKLVILFGHHLQCLRKTKELRYVQNVRILALLKAGGFTTARRSVRNGTLPDEFLTSQPKGDLNLKHECRKVIRRRLFAVQLHQNVISKVCQLGLPSILEEYLLFGIFLD